MQINSALPTQPKQHIIHEQNGDIYNKQDPTVQMQTNGRTLLKLGQNPVPPLQPAVQINIQSLIKPIPGNEKSHVQPAPIVYSFGQPDFGNKYMPMFGNVRAHEKNVPNKKINWGMETAFDYNDDFADILGLVSVKEKISF